MKNDNACGRALGEGGWTAGRTTKGKPGTWCVTNTEEISKKMSGKQRKPLDII